MEKVLNKNKKSTVVINLCVRLNLKFLTENITATKMFNTNKEAVNKSYMLKFDSITKSNIVIFLFNFFIVSIILNNLNKYYVFFFNLNVSIICKSSKRLFDISLVMCAFKILN